MKSGLERMRELVGAFARHLEESRDLPGLAAINPGLAPAGRLVFCGMGGSAIGAELVSTLLGAGDSSLDVWRDYGLPFWVGAGDLVLVGSYSGGTEESLSALREARRRGARVILITSGGVMAAQRREDEPLIMLPPGLPPRAALGYSLGGLLQVLHRLGYLEGMPGDLEESLTVLKAGRMPTGLSFMELAQELEGRFPVLYAGDPVAAAVAVRWKGQLNENAKWPASVAVFPELNHNDIVGWEMSSAWRERLVLVILRSGLESERIGRRIELTTGLLADQFQRVVSLEAVGYSALTRMLSLVHYGDRLSCELAALRGVDPMPVTRIDQLKNGLQ
ncbi:bifunctional phosphoglucose/phosphomannose isomerase [bacterium DOLJORAL78_65_58]|nr:MAG: bifunctional phosphoglucose/phosphomannose isomerase [bacterium DOLZORAL124_64_63]PIE76460.1 MAG: bifunctional phosphoglucose/phosphomannose isomerase [bacterium DOLJORAL78_65_58]